MLYKKGDLFYFIDNLTKTCFSPQYGANCKVNKNSHNYSATFLPNSYEVIQSYVQCVIRDYN